MTGDTGSSLPVIGAHVIATDFLFHASAMGLLVDGKTDASGVVTLPAFTLKTPAAEVDDNIEFEVYLPDESLALQPAGGISLGGACSTAGSEKQIGTANEYGDAVPSPSVPSQLSYPALVKDLASKGNAITVTINKNPTFAPTCKAIPQWPPVAPPAPPSFFLNAPPFSPLPKTEPGIA